MTIAINREELNGVLVASLDGRLDSSNSKTAETELLSMIANRPAVVLDLGGLSYISSAGLRTILLAGKQMRSSAGALALCNLPGPVREVFEISGFLSIFKVYDARPAAVAAVQPA